MMKNIYKFLFLAFLVVSCEKPIDWDLHTEDINTIVVEAVITSEFKTHQINLSYPIASMNDTPQPVREAKISVFFDPYEVFFLESDTLPGVYYSAEPFKAALNVDYNLSIEVDTITYSAQTNMVQILPYGMPPFVYHEELGKYKLHWDLYQYSMIEQALYEVIVNWEHLSGYDHPDSLSYAKLLFYKFKTIDVSYIVSPQDREDVSFPPGSNVELTKYSLNDEYASYLRALLIESQWQGSIFEGSRGNLPGNISNGGLGFFATCDVGILSFTLE